MDRDIGDEGEEEIEIGVESQGWGDLSRARKYTSAAEREIG